MKKRILSIILLLNICIATIYIGSIDVLAEEKALTVGCAKDIDYSYFSQVNTLYGYANTSRGVYLATGDSAITKINSYTIGVGGQTNAALRCDVSVTTVVERYNMEKDSWGYITSWTKSNTNAFTAIISKTLIVDSGYYYRVRSYHSAGTDSSSSYTNALYVGN